MAISEQDIQQVFNCYNEERYHDARLLLNSLIEKDQTNHHIYYFLAICSIYMDHLDDALISLGEVVYLNPNHIPSMHALAYVFLRKGDFEAALNKWLAIKSIAPKDPLMNQILSKIKNKQLYKDPLNRYHIDDFIQLDIKELKRGLLFNTPSIENTPSYDPSRMLSSDQVQAFYPKKLRNRKKNTLYWKIIFGLPLFLCIFFGIGKWITHHKTSTQGYIHLSQEPVFFSLQESEIKGKYQNLLQSMHNKNISYNQKILKLNELYYSNINTEMKNQIHKLKQELPLPSIKDPIQDIVPVTNILNNPILYQGVVLSANGVISNFLKRPQYLSFDLNLSTGEKIPCIYFYNKTAANLPFNNQDTLLTKGVVSVDENQHLLMDTKYIQLLKTPAEPE